jgi:AraC family transcriptional regulator, alkane utilization regulator
MDILSDVLRVIRFSGVIHLKTELTAPWSIESASGANIADMLQSYTKRIIPFHIVAEGKCWAKTSPDLKQELEIGDIIIFPQGNSHILADQIDREPIPFGQLLPASPWNQLPTLKYGGGGTLTQLICGFLQCDELIFDPLLKNLPALMYVKAFAAPATPLLETGVRYILQETTNIQPGSLCLLTRLVELMFVEILRTYMRCLPETQMGWLAALNDPMIGQVLNWLHAEPTYPWTVPELAKRLGLSRSALAHRFTQLLGQPPMQYLAQWRLQLASSYLQNTDEGLAKIATQVGYESEAAFSRAFKRYVGQSPGTWRNRKVQ